MACPCRSHGAAAVGGDLAQARQAEVEHLEARIAGDEDVLRLDVAMDDALRVRSLEHVQQPVGDPQHLARVEAPSVLDALLELANALEQLHDKERMLSSSGRRRGR